MDKQTALQNFINHHMVDSAEWHPLPGVNVPLPEWLTLHGAMMIVCSLICILLFCVLYKKDEEVPSGLTNMMEVFVVFIRDDICIPSLGERDGRRLAPLFLTFFFFIAGLNVMSLIPLFGTATSNINITGALAAITLVVMIGGAILLNGPVGFMKAFIPHGVPAPVLLLVVPIEFMGMFIKCFALMIRLFANMLAGHIIIFSLLGLVVTFGMWGAPAILMALGIYTLEILVVFLQAYIFTLLSAMFIGMIHHPAH